MTEQTEIFTEIVDMKGLRELAQSGAKIHALVGTGWRSANSWTTQSLPEWAVMYSPSMPAAQIGVAATKR